FHRGTVENRVKNPGPKVAPARTGAPRTSAPKGGKTKPRVESSSKPAAAKGSPPTHRFIVLEGPICVGKTSLAAKQAASLGAELVLENADQNPFLERFYRQPRSGALPAQLYFLFQRAQQLATLKQHDLFAPLRVADYLFDKDRLFARVTLDDEE